MSERESFCISGAIRSEWIAKMEFVSPPLTVRRNPPRKAKTPASRPPEVLIPSSFSATDRPPLRPIHANLQSPPSVEEVKKPFQQKPSESPADADTLRVFLRIRPPKGLKTKQNAACTRRRSKEEGDRVCLIVKDSRSVTLTAPASLVDPKRIKNETFDGFSHVFQPESSQVYGFRISKTNSWCSFGRLDCGLETVMIFRGYFCLIPPFFSVNVSLRFTGG